MVNTIDGNKFTVESSARLNDDNNFYGLDWSVHNENGKYYFRYLLALQGGGEAQIEIIESEYRGSRNGDLDGRYYLNKYGESGTRIR